MQPSSTPIDPIEAPAADMEDLVLDGPLRSSNAQTDMSLEQF